MLSKSALIVETKIGETEIAETAEYAGELQHDLSIEVDQRRMSAYAMLDFPDIQGQMQCKSEEDDGYCSRASLDSPFQALQSDSEANDQEVFTAKDGSAAAANKTRKTFGQMTYDADTVCHVPTFTSTTTVPASSKISSFASHPQSSNGHQKILIVNKASNVKYILPTIGSLCTQTELSPSANRASLTDCIQSVPNRVNVKLLQPDLNKIKPEQTTVCGAEEKNSPILSTIPTTLLISDDTVTISASKSFSDATNVPVVIKPFGQNVGNSGLVDICVNSTRHDTASNLPTKAVMTETAVVLQQQNGIITQNKEDSDVQVSDELTFAAVSYDCKADTTLETDSIATERFSSEDCMSLTSTEQNRQVDQARDSFTPHITACQNQMVFAQKTVSALCRSVLGTGNGNRVESGTVFQTLGNHGLKNPAKPYIPSSVVGEGGLAGVTTTGNCSGQNVTVILLPQNSVQSITKKPSANLNSKQVLLRTGQGQLFKAISVKSENFKTESPKIAEKLVHANCDSTKLVLRSVAGSSTVLNRSKGAAKCQDCRENTVINKMSNGIVLGGSRLLEDSLNSDKQNSDKGLSMVARSSANIGHFASLTSPGLHLVSDTKPEAQCPTFSSLVTSFSAKSKVQHAVAAAISPCIEVAEASDKSDQSQSRVLHSSIPSAQKLCHLMTSLHPLIDHDYCQFSAFCADVQSSIISLTETNIRPERRCVKKNRATKTKAVHVSQYSSKSGSTENRPKRKYCKRKHMTDGSSSKKYSASNSKLKGKSRVCTAQSKGATGTLRDDSQSTADKDYVKIPGYYQDEFVYYATKRLPVRPRNRSESVSRTAETIVTKQSIPSSGISMFDWYKEMAQTDKTTRFGSDCSVRSSELLEESESSKCCTPANESDVADLVMDLLPASDLARPISDEMKYVSTSIVESLLSNSYDLSTLSTRGNEVAVDGNTDLNLMAEEVRIMLSSMGEAELKMLESHLENEKINDEVHDGGLDINSFLGDYVTQENNMSHSSSSNFLDVDDITDGDLLPADITNMNIILNDLDALNHKQVSDKISDTKVETNGIASLFDKNANLCDDIVNCVRDNGVKFAKDGELSQTRNNPEKVSRLGISSASTLPISSKPTGCNSLVLSDTSPPELTTINMFWNDLPGLLINGMEFVRLVDIHKQIMPAKDTGILKKRCHMMGLHITNCSELQRDFLVRYMNAAKSKSTVIITKDEAIMLIGFYVTPKSRARGSDDLELELLKPPSKRAKFDSKQREELPWLADKQKDKDLTSTSELLSTVSWPDKRSTLASVNSSESPQPLVKHVDKSCSSGNATGSEVKRSERLRHKHISYSSMVHGGLEENEKANKLEITTRTKCSTNDLSTGSIFICTKLHTTLGFNHLANERKELENLIREQKRRRLSLEVKLRLKLLRSLKRSFVSRPKISTDHELRRTRKCVMKRTKRSRQVLAQNRNWTVRKGTSVNLHTLEHCYAALPAHFTNSSKHRNFTSEQQSSDRYITRKCIKGVGSPENATPAASSSSALKTRASTESKSNSVRVVHRDITRRANRRRRSQIGELIPHLYTSTDAPCIRCVSCRDMMTVADFMKHVHWRHGSEKLLQITVAQKLLLQSSVQLPESVVAWEAFLKKRAVFESVPGTGETFVVPCKEKPQTVTPETTDIKSAPETKSAIPSTRHSSRVLNRKQLISVEKPIFAKSHSGAEVTVTGPDLSKRKHSAETEKLSLATVDHRSLTTSRVKLSNCSRKIPQSNGNKRRTSKRQRRQPIIQSDRLLRVTARRLQDS